MILIIKHIEIEGPGTLFDFFLKSSYQMKIIELDRGEELPPLEKCQAVISLGGPMNVYEEEKHPFLKKEIDFIQHTLKNQIPFLGICLGAQLLVKAAGGKIKKLDTRELGWYKVRLTQQGKKDSLFKDLEDLEVFQWHEDFFEIPRKGELLATCDTCHNQTVRVGNSAWGLQFHPEMTIEMLLDWFEYYREDLDEKKILRQYCAIKDRYFHQAELLYLNFAKAIERNRGV